MKCKPAAWVGSQRVVAKRHRVILNVATQADRKKQRATLGRLRDLRIQPDTERRYVLAYSRLIVFAVRTEQLPIRDLHHLDELMGSHIEEMLDEGEPKSWSSDAVAGVLHVLPSARNNFAISWSLIQAWNRRELPCRALPLTPELTAALAGGFLHAGFPRLAAGIVVGFDTLARTGELLNLVVEDVLVDTTSGFAGVLRFRETKAGARQGVDQSVTITSPIVRGALRFLCKGLDPGAQLLQIRDRKFRQIWAHGVSCLGLEGLT